MASTKKTTTEVDFKGGAAVRSELRTAAILTWDPARIVQARLRASYGDFSLFSDLCESMMPDDRVSQCLEKLYSATTLPLTFELPGKDSKQSQKDPSVQALDADWWKMLPEQVMRTAVTWLALANCALMHIDGWTTDEDTGRVIPVVTCWSLRNLRHDPKLGWTVRVASSVGDSYGNEVPITPGDGNWILLLSGTSWKAISQARGHGLALFWLLKQYAIVDWANYSERHGQGTSVAECTNEIGQGIKLPQRAELANQMKSLARNGQIVMPPGWTYRLVTDTANSSETFQSQIKAADSAAVISIVGTNLTSEVKGGSFAAASVHETVDASRMRGILEFLSTGFREQLVKHWARHNSASWVAPYPKWDTTPPANKEAEAKARLADSQALKNYVDAGLKPSRKAWAERAGVEIGKGDDALVAAPKAEPKAASPLPANLDNGDGSEDDQGDDVVVDSKARSSLGSQFLALASETEPKDALARGWGYVDRLSANIRREAAKELAPTLAGVLTAIDGAESYEEAKAAIIAAYGDELPPSKLLKLTEAALIMGQLAGIESIEQELDEP